MKESNIGLKGFWKRHQGASLRFKLRELRWELRYALRRAWYGYDDVDVFDLGLAFLRRMPILLREFKKNNTGMWYDRDQNKQLTEEETDAIIDELIYAFDLCDEETWLQHIDPNQCDKWTPYLQLEEHRQNTIHLFAKWCTTLWY